MTATLCNCDHEDCTGCLTVTLDPTLICPECGAYGGHGVECSQSDLCPNCGAYPCYCLPTYNKVDGPSPEEFKINHKWDFHLSKNLTPYAGKVQDLEDSLLLYTNIGTPPWMDSQMEKW